MVNLPIGTSDYRTIRQDGRLYIDKTLLIKEVIDGASTILATRPRRFRKTLNLSTLRYFYGCDADHSALFEGLAITEAGERYMAKFGKHPVIFMSFKDIKDDDWDGAWRSILSVIHTSTDFSAKDFEQVRDKLQLERQNILDRFFGEKSNREDFKSLLKCLHEAMFRDTNAPAAENFYHAFFLGMLVRLGHRFVLQSNRESGYGRFDIALFPRNPEVENGLIIEIKAPQPRQKETLRMALNAAVRQLKAQSYAAEMSARGVRKVLQIALAVQSKAFLVKKI